MEIKNSQVFSYKDLTHFDDAFLSQMVSLEEDVWGRREIIGEHLVCSSPNCRAVYSIEDVYQDKMIPGEYTILSELQKDGLRTPNCTECEGTTERIFKPEEYREYTREYFNKGAFSSFLIDEDNNIQGFANGIKESRRNIIEMMNYRGEYNVERALKKIEQIAGGGEEAILFTKLAVREPYRGKGYAIPLMKEGVFNYPEYDDLPMIIDTQMHGGVYPYFKSFGQQVIQREHRLQKTSRSARKENQQQQ